MNKPPSRLAPAAFLSPTAILTAILTAIILTTAVAALALAEPPPLSVPVLLPGDDAIGPAAGKQMSPEIAAGDDMHLVVWVDDRSALNQINTFSGGPNFEPNNGSMWDIYAARLDASGALVDSIPIVVAQQTLNQMMPDVAWNGENWLVVWSGQEGLACCANTHIYAARVSPAGEVLDPVPIVVDLDETNNGLLWSTVASDGTNWAVVWRDLDEQAGIFTLDGARIAPDGTVLDPGGVRLRRDTHNSYPVDPDLVFATDEYLLVWSEDSAEVKGQRLTPALAPIGGVFQINLDSPTRGLNPRVATDGDQFFVAYWEARYDAFSQLRGARVSHDGQVLDPAGIEITEAYGYTNYEPSVAWDGSVYYVVFDHDAFSPDIAAARVTTSGAVLDFGGFMVAEAPGLQNETAAAPLAGGGIVAAWKDHRYGGPFPSDVFAAIVTGTTASPASSLSLGAPRQTELDLTANGTGFLAVYRSETAQGARILAQPLDGSGLPADSGPFEIAAGGHEVRSPAVAWDGEVHLAVWEVGNQIFGRRLDGSGSPIDDAFFVLPGNQPGAGALGGVFLVASSHESPHEIRQIKGVRVRGSDGAILDASPFVVGPNHSFHPSIAAVGARWLVAFERWPTHDNSRASILANFVEGSGAPGAYFGVATDAIDVERNPSVASSGDTALVVWEDDRPNPYFEDIYARRVLADGTILDPSRGFPISTANNGQYEPAVAWDGSVFVAVFGDTRNESQYGQRKGDIFAARAQDGAVIDPAGFPVATDTLPEVHPDVTAMDGLSVLGYSAFKPDARFAAYRIVLRLAGALPTSAEEGAIAGSPIRGGILRAYPNPSSGAVRLRLEGSGLDESAASTSARGGVFDLAGRRVASLFGSVDALVWDGRDAEGRPAPPGAYFGRVEAGGREWSVKILKR